MDNIVYLNNLYDIYGELLTDKQKLYFEDYYYNNLSLQEISDIYNISRSAIHRQLNLVEEKLKEYENKLNLYDNKNKIKKLLNEVQNEQLKLKIEELL